MERLFFFKFIFLPAILLFSFSSFACGRKLVIPGTIKVFETKNFKDGSKEVISWGKMKVLFTKFNNLHSHVYKSPLRKKILITDLSTPSDYFFKSFSYWTSIVQYLVYSTKFRMYQCIYIYIIRSPKLSLNKNVCFSE